MYQQPTYETLMADLARFGANAECGWKNAANPEPCTLPARESGWYCPAHRAMVAGLDNPLGFIGFESGSNVQPEPRKARGASTGEATPDPLASERAEAMAYIRDYTGTWGFILDLRADRKWGTKWFRLTDRMVEVVLNSKRRDEARKAEAAAQPADADTAAAIAWVLEHRTSNDFAASLAGGLERYGRLTPNQQAAVLRNIARTAPRADGTTAQPVTEAGWYRLDGDVYKVQKAVHGSGNLYAKVLVVDGHGSAHWEYAQGAIRRLTADMALTVEEASEMGRLYGVCMVCGATLTDEGSIERGIGPVCIKRLG